MADTDSGIGIFGALGVLSVGLKLGGVINWSWWWVTLPFWGPLTIISVIFVIAFIIALSSN